MDLPMAAKKTRKPTKKTGSKAAKARKPVAKPKKGTATRAKARAVRKVAKSQVRAKVRKVAPKARPKPPKAEKAPARPVRKPEKAKAVAARKPEKAAPAVERRGKVEPAGRRDGAANGLKPPRPSSASLDLPRGKPAKGNGDIPKGKPSRSGPASSPGADIPKGKPSRSGGGVPEARGSKRGAPPLKEGGKGRGSSPGRGAPLREPPARLVSLPLPILTPVRRPSIEERAASIEIRLAAATSEFRRRYEESLDMSWIYHDSALEGVVYTFDELRTALSGQAPPVTDSSLQPTYDDIRRHKEAIEHVRALGLNRKAPVSIDDIKKIYLILHPEEGDLKTVKYRKDIPQHRLYFHEYAPPDKIAYKVRQVVEWLSDPETRKTRNGIRIAARAHYDLLRVYPFPTDSGKCSRLFMNLLLMRSGLPPAIIHSTERQRYYEALKGSATTVLQMVQEAVENALSSVEKLLDEHETKKRAFVS
jgi:hypothetical protein